MNRKFKILILLLFLSSGYPALCQKPAYYSSAEVLHRMQKLNILGNVLYVAAHPDDENTAMITYMANEAKVNTAYFSFTRGDGGQNLIGPEFGDQLGVIRTQELLAARRTDRGSQYFSRAIDFGYSKNPEETFSIWNKEEVLGDLIWIIRKFRPDIIITRFNTIPTNNHGHHTASAILAREAFDLAANPNSYPDQLKFVSTWQPRTLYWNTYPWFRSDYQKDTADLLSVDIGKFNPVLGMSYSEISALSRSNHKSQGFGATGSRGMRKEYLQYEKGTKAENSVFDVTDISWGRVSGGEKIQKLVDQILAHYNAENPSASLPALLEIRENVQQLKDEFWKEIKTTEIAALIAAVTGLYLEVSAPDYYACPGDSMLLQVEAINRSNAIVTMDSIIWPDGYNTKTGLTLGNNAGQMLKINYLISPETKFSQPYWLAEKHITGLFYVKDQQSIGMAESRPALEATIFATIQGQKIKFTRPVIYKLNDPVQGELYRPFVIMPPAFVSLSRDVVLFSSNEEVKLTADVRSVKDQFTGKFSLSLPADWKVSPMEYEISPMKKGEIQPYEFSIVPPEGQQSAVGVAHLVSEGRDYAYDYVELKYDHIPTQTLMPESSAKFVKLDISVGNEKLGYLSGPGDDVPTALRQLGYSIELINDLDFTAGNLDAYDVIILGVRSLNTVGRLRNDLSKLFEFASRGGNLIVQYNTSQGLVNNQIMPYKLQLSRNRVTDENSEVRILNPEHPVLQYPNKITKADFDGWIQERGLYFPDQWGVEFQPIISMNDKGEAPLDGGILVADYGNGKVIHTSLAWFRQLPAGVPGAYRIFVNLISQKQ